MKEDTAKTKLFKELDNAFNKYGVVANMANPGFFPHYSEINSETVRPTWYTQYQIDKNTTLITMYETIRDLCISVLMESGKATRCALHTGYPQDIEDARCIYTQFKEK